MNWGPKSQQHIKCFFAVVVSLVHMALRDLMGRREDLDHSGFKNPRISLSKYHHQTSPDYHLYFKTYQG